MRLTNISRNSYRLRLFILMTAFILTISFSALMQPAFAISVPKVTIDDSCLNQEGNTVIIVRGTVSQAKGQTIALYEKDGETVLAEIAAWRTSFSLTVPDQYVQKNMGSDGKITVYVQSQAMKGMAASKKVQAIISCKKPLKAQTITAPAKMTLTNLKTTASIGAKTSSGLKLTYKSSKPKVVSVSSSGKLTRKKNGTATITITQAGDSKYSVASKKVKVTCRKSTCQEQIDGAVAWAVKIANDNSFSYGTGSGAHHFGCYFCGTNYGPNKYMKPSKKYKKTYCCNPFVSAAYAHGAQHPKMLEACKRASGIGMSKDTFYRYGCWKCVGKPSYSKLKKGDVLVKSSHVAMYIGKGKMVEASGGDWSAGSIAVKKMSKSRYNGFSFVMRYTGY